MVLVTTDAAIYIECFGTRHVLGSFATRVMFATLNPFFFVFLCLVR